MYTEEKYIAFVANGYYLLHLCRCVRDICIYSIYFSHLLIPIQFIQRTLRYGKPNRIFSLSENTFIQLFSLHTLQSNKRKTAKYVKYTNSNDRNDI